ncbi:2-succinylbenzoate--CoA ligase [Pseudovibrio sp. Ad5]|uniref:class I adenylate-forming enzyme family protein n=2 Tax=unclassified Pseudovibrio TaxID=2627060 RepID=UPI0007AE8634|nr:class I adenylate-forming enzyme family protein [Pseudovibrio sp. Ad5]KZL01741.1 2-succinylbenzoate--CoA ligase [Pseudovibrio sp. Ad5]
MILSNTDAIANHSTTGVWGNITLDMLFRRAAQKHPNRLALVDAPDRETWTGGKPRHLTYAEAEQEISRIAGFFAAVGMEPDHILGLQSPNTVDNVLCILGALRAGLIVSPFPLHWRHSEILRALSTVDAKALITADRVETRMLGEEARDAAADFFSLRFVFGLGSDIPDGLIDMAPMLAESGDSFPEPVVERDGAPANHVATLTWVHSGSEISPIPRSHNHWVSTGLMPFLETRLEPGARILLPYILCGITGIGAGLVPWLLSEGTLHLHHPHALSTLTDHARSIEANYILTPGPLASHIDGALEGWKTNTVATWAITSPTPAKYKAKGIVTDLHVLDEYALVAHLRGTSEEPVPLIPGNQFAPSTSTHGPCLINIDPVEINEEYSQGVSTTAPGYHLKLKGAMVPDADWPTNESHLTFFSNEQNEHGLITQIPVGVHNVTGAIHGFGTPGQKAPGLLELERLDEIYSEFSGVKEAAAFLVEDELMGARLMVAVVPSEGLLVDVEAFYAYLDASRVSLTMMPHRILSLRALPMTEGGTVDRQKLTRRSQPKPVEAVA